MPIASQHWRNIRHTRHSIVKTACHAYLSSFTLGCCLLMSEWIKSIINWRVHWLACILYRRILERNTFNGNKLIRAQLVSIGLPCWYDTTQPSFNDFFQENPGMPVPEHLQCGSPMWILLELMIMEVVVTTGSTRLAKLQSNHHHQQTNTQFFTGHMPLLSSNRLRTLHYWHRNSKYSDALTSVALKNHQKKVLCSVEFSLIVHQKPSQKFTSQWWLLFQIWYCMLHSISMHRGMASIQPCN